MKKINPYHYALIDSLLIPKNGSETWDDLTSQNAHHRSHLDQRIERLGKRVLAKILPILSLKVNKRPIFTWNQLKALQAEYSLPVDTDAEDYDPWDHAHQPQELTLMLALAANERPGNVDWQSFSDIFESLDEQDRSDMAAIFAEMYGVDIPQLLDTSTELWETPLKIQDLPATRSILGRDFHEIAEGKWRRVDLELKQFKIHLLQRCESYDEEERETTYYIAHNLVGCAATLEGAIEVAARIQDKLIARYEIDNRGVSFLVNEDYRAIQITDTKGNVRLYGALMKDITQRSGIACSIPYVTQWQHPIERSQVDQVKQQIKALCAEASEESRWDNHSTAQDLRSSARKLELQLPSENHDSYADQEALRRTMIKIGNHQQAGSLLGRDLGL